MKFLILLPGLMLQLCMAQNTGIGTTLPKGKLHIKGTHDTTQLFVEAFTSQSISKPLMIFSKNGGDVLHINSDYQSNLFMGVNAGKVNSGAIHNVFVGMSVGAVNTSGVLNTGLGSGALGGNISGNYNTALGAAANATSNTSNNTAVGFQALFNGSGGMNTALGASAMHLSSSSITRNVAIGYEALRGSTTPPYNTGSNNTAIGAQAMWRNTTGYENTAIGNYALYNTTTAPYNTAIGRHSLYANTTGYFNTALGSNAMYYNNIGNFNVGAGYSSLLNTTASENNTAIGHQSGDSYNNGYNNVFVGAFTEVTGNDFYNVIAVGQGTVVSGPSVARFGNSATVSYGGYAGWTNISDGRFKGGLQENVPGLSFINMLRPVTYQLKATLLDKFLHSKNELSENATAVHNQALLEKEKITYSGFVAQEVEDAARSLGFDFSGIDKPKNASDVYGLRYAEFVVPLVKAVQELAAKNEILMERITTLEKANAELKK